jgi:hypothetical protein
MLCTKNLTDDYKVLRMELCLMTCYVSQGQQFLQFIVAGYNKCAIYETPEEKNGIHDVEILNYLPWQ